MLASALAVLASLLPAASPVSSAATRVAGDYIEARTADVYTGPCFSNAEIFITGHQAVLAWKVTEGSWKGVELNGLSVAAAVVGTTTFSQDDMSAAKAVLVVDQKATPAQHDALIEMAKALGGDRLKHVVAVRTASLIVTVEDHKGSSESEEADSHKAHGMPRAPQALFSAAGLAEILTRPLGADDHVCGNEAVAYEPLSSGVQALPAYTLRHRYSGDELDTLWNDPNCRSSFVGRFSY
ncbi:DUF1326 domain-containing protein [Planctomyces sp. SH-PL62]|uniref:DUF1326 domain-containing protein n=1 Tax=Planctomyces sp. SH-PL62 TaxID=1636152 RepID=UPI00078B6BE3|nr:DUF1326 domain-containing protein [Planctomyces sp. SH-PL62]AMV38801.1 hypothetical protein VT85_15300 [Planctomyces sp. SH-PL62]